MCCRVLQSTDIQSAFQRLRQVCCSVLQCVAMSSSVLQCIVVCCSVMQFAALEKRRSRSRVHDTHPGRF